VNSSPKIPELTEIFYKNFQMVGEGWQTNFIRAVSAPMMIEKWRKMYKKNFLALKILRRTDLLQV
jgi:hypothetical protein